jgi:flagellar motor switch protein FliM
MSDGGFHSVLRRKAVAGKPRGRPGQLSPERAIVQALSKAAQDLMNLPLRVEENAAALVSPVELAEHLPDRALLTLLGGASDRLGVLALDPAAMTALLEMQMLGRIGDDPLPSRRPTRTDAAMCRTFIDRFLEQLETELGNGAPEAAVPRWAAGYRYGSMLDDPRPLTLLLEDGDLRLFRVTLDFGLGPVRRGVALLALPADGTEAMATVGPAGAGAEDPGAAAWDRSWAAAVQQAPARLDAVLGVVTLPLGQVLALTTGAELTLPIGALDRIEFRDRTGQARALGRLGQAEGGRAVRITTLLAGEDAAALPDSQFGTAAVGPLHPLSPASSVAAPLASARPGPAGPPADLGEVPDDDLRPLPLSVGF